jgi:hypothetical protein
MSEMNVDKPGVFLGSKTVDSEIADPQDQNRAKIEDLPTKPKPGRLPARASRI